MKIIKKGFLFVAALWATMMCLGGIISLIEVLRDADFSTGKPVVMIIFLLMIAGFGWFAFKCYKSVFRKEQTSRNREPINFPVAKSVLDQKQIFNPAVEANTQQHQTINNSQHSKVDSIQQQNAEIPIVCHEVSQEIFTESNTELGKATYVLPEEIKELLWIKGKEQACDPNLINEPSLIDMALEIQYDTADSVQDIGYYPSYRNLKPANRYNYLNWLRDVTAPIPIGYVFIFYYGLERHLIFGKFEQAFNMIVKLRHFHDNNSFNAYSADALLIAALYHKRLDLISKIDLNKATPKLAQFVIASLTGRIESELLIENCREVGFTNKRYIKSDYDLFKQMLEDVLNEKYGYKYYPVSDNDFSKCTGNFLLALANYSLKLNERMANAPDLSTNEEYLKNVFEILNETHERVKRCKRKERTERPENDSTVGESNILGEYQEIDLQNYADVQQEYDFLVSHVTYSTSSHEDIPFSFEEEVFFKALIKAMKENKLWEKERLRLKRLANNTFNVDCHTCYIGKVKLRNKMFIQVQRGSSQVKTYSDVGLVECLDKIPAWIRYIKYCRKN